MHITNIYSPGSSLSKALRIVKRYNEKGISCSLSYLPIRKDKPSLINQDVATYHKMLNEISKHHLNSDVTLKLHPFGIYENYVLAKENVEKIVQEAKRLHKFVWIDMERTRTTDDTINMYIELRKKYNNVGICLQAYLKRTEGDMKHLLKEKATIRLVKGFYKDTQFKSWDEVSENYSKLMKYLLLYGIKPIIATHDLDLISEAKEIIRKHKIKNAEFQFFKGVRDKLVEELVKEGYKVRIYVPYGNIWRFILKGLPTFDKFRHIQRLLGFKKII